MHADEQHILQELIGALQVQFQIPVYQRNYDWNEKNCSRLLDDIESILETGKKHFIGAIVYLNSTRKTLGFKELTIIDGQQRLTTIMILLKAIADVSASVNDKESEGVIMEINTAYFFNPLCHDEKYKLKLKPIKNDNEQFVKLLSNDSSIEQECHIYKNYRLFKDGVETLVKRGYTTRQILDSIYNLVDVSIELTPGEDDPQIIFESINSTGMALAQSDLIRNFMLMSEPNQEDLFENYWLYIEKKLKRENDYSNLDLFFKQYIVYKTSAEVKKGSLYERFVELYKSSKVTKEECFADLKYYADIFAAFVYDEDKYSPAIRKSLKELRSLKQTTWHPFLMHVFNDYTQKLIDEKTVEKVSHFIVSYLLRRIVCGVTSNTLKGLFTSLYGAVFKIETNKGKYYEAINKFLDITLSTNATPKDDEFKRALLNGNIYRNKALCKYLLADIENEGYKETLNVDDLTIEHIMPQTLSPDWMEFVTQEEHEKYLHVLGNLTVTGYNSELSNKPFKEKQRLIRENSKARILNLDVVDESIEVWNVGSIQQRSKRLAKIIMSHYKIEPIQDSDISFESVDTYTLDQGADFTNRKLYSFTFENTRYNQNKFALMLEDIVRILDKKDPNKLEDLAARKFSFNKARHPFISKNCNDVRSPWEVKEGIFVELHMPSNQVVDLVAVLLDEYNINRSALSISVLRKEEEQIIDADEDEE